MKNGNNILRIIYAVFVIVFVFYLPEKCKGPGAESKYYVTTINSEYSGRVSNTVHSKVAYFMLAHDEIKYKVSTELKEIYPNNIYGFLKENDSILKLKGIDTLCIFRDSLVFKLKVLDSYK